MPEAAWRAAIAALLPRPAWPAQPLLITAVDATTGEPVQFTRDSGVSLLDAVAASCAVPGVWPPVTIGDRRYMDGGVRSLTNADLATGYARVLILLPSAPLPPTPFFGSPAREQALLEAQGSAVLLVHADAAALAAIGPNALDPARRSASARAGQAQGRAVAGQVRAFWTGAGA